MAEHLQILLSVFLPVEPKLEIDLLLEKRLVAFVDDHMLDAIICSIHILRMNYRSKLIAYKWSYKLLNKKTYTEYVDILE